MQLHMLHISTWAYRLVRCHTNLLLERNFASEKADAVLEWETEMEIDDPLAEDGGESEEGEHEEED